MRCRSAGLVAIFLMMGMPIRSGAAPFCQIFNEEQAKFSLLTEIPFVRYFTWSRVPPRRAWLWDRILPSFVDSKIQGVANLFNEPWSIFFEPQNGELQIHVHSFSRQNKAKIVRALLLSFRDQYEYRLGRNITAPHLYIDTNGLTLTHVFLDGAGRDLLAHFEVSLLNDRPSIASPSYDFTTHEGLRTWDFLETWIQKIVVSQMQDPFTLEEVMTVD